MGRISRGWQLTKESWAVVRTDRSLLLFPVVAGVSSIVVGAVFIALGAGVGTAADSFWGAAPFLAVGLYAVTAIGQFFAVALAACATMSLDGHDTQFSDGIAAARSRLGIILGWSAITLVVSALITALETLLRDLAGNLVGSIIGGLANLAWSVATFLVVPVIALEELGPQAAIKRSTQVIRERWGEGVVGTASIGAAIFFVGILPGIAIVVAGVALMDSVPIIGVGVLTLGALVILAAYLLQTALTSVFRVALFRYATAGDAAGHFTAEQLQGAFAPKRRRR